MVDPRADSALPGVRCVPRLHDQGPESRIGWGRCVTGDSTVRDGRWSDIRTFVVCPVPWDPAPPPGDSAWAVGQCATVVGWPSCTSGLTARSSWSARRWRTSSTPWSTICPSSRPTNSPGPSRSWTCRKRGSSARTSLSGDLGRIGQRLRCWRPALRGSGDLMSCLAPIARWPPSAMSGVSGSTPHAHHRELRR